MVFTTLTFMAFMAVLFILYYLIPAKYQWKLLLIASFCFYAYASPWYLLFLTFTVVVSYVGALWIAGDQSDGKRPLVVVVILLLSMLGIFKYGNFFLDNIGLGERVSLNMILPVGLSFYLFQSLGYCIDVYRGIVEPEENIFKHALFVSYFPQLLQGPIGDYGRLAPQFFVSHSFDYREVTDGLKRVVWGFFKKLVIANQISLILDSVWMDVPQYHGIVVWVMFLFLYSIQLYADFSGYMDIAIGCSQMLGIKIDENFKTPYFSKNIAEFWRNWHITLGTWFKNYVFYSIMRSRLCKKIMKKYRKTNPYLSNVIPNVIALVIVWLLIGIWHGDNWCYVVYGLYHGTFIIVSTIFEPLYSRFHNRFPKIVGSDVYAVAQMLRTFLIVSFGYVIFRPANLENTKMIINAMFNGNGIVDAMSFGKNYFSEFLIIFIGIIVLTIVDVWHYRNDGASLRQTISSCSILLRYAFYVLAVVAILILGAYGSAELNQFAYFRF